MRIERKKPLRAKRKRFLQRGVYQDYLPADLVIEDMVDDCWKVIRLSLLLSAASAGALAYIHQRELLAMTSIAAKRLRMAMLRAGGSISPSVKASLATLTRFETVVIAGMSKAGLCVGNLFSSSKQSS